MNDYQDEMTQQPRLAEGMGEPPAMDDKTIEMQQHMAQLQQESQQFPQRLAQQLDLQTHTGMPPQPPMQMMRRAMQMRAMQQRRMQMMQQQQRRGIPGINGAPVQNQNPAMPYPQMNGGIRG